MGGRGGGERASGRVGHSLLDGGHAAVVEATGLGDRRDRLTGRLVRSLRRVAGRGHRGEGAHEDASGLVEQLREEGGGG